MDGEVEEMEQGIKNEQQQQQQQSRCQMQEQRDEWCVCQVLEWQLNLGTCFIAGNEEGSDRQQQDPLMEEQLLRRSKEQQLGRRRVMIRS